MLKKIMVVIVVLLLSLYLYSYTEIGFKVSSIKEQEVLLSIEESDPLIASINDQGLYVAIYGDGTNLSVYEFAQNPLTKRYSLTRHYELEKDDVTIIEGVYHALAKTSIYEVAYQADLDTGLIVLESSEIRADVVTRFVWDAGIAVLIVVANVYYDRRRSKRI